MHNVNVEAVERTAAKAAREVERGRPGQGSFT
jgi:hypothetical protein